MSRPPLRNLVAWLCLICFGINTTLLSGGLVLCSDRGGSRVELGCLRDAKGACQTACCTTDCSDDDGSQTPRPCNDTPLQGDHQIPKVAAAERTVSVAPMLLVATVILQSLDVTPLPSQQVRIAFAPDRPPDAVARLKTVVLLV